MENESPMILKANLRSEIKSRFHTYSALDYDRANERIHRRFHTLPEVSRAKTVMIYHSIYQEVETIPLIVELLRQGKTIALPVCIAGFDLEARRIVDLNHLRNARFGLLEPPDHAPLVEPERFDLVVVPGLAFDAQGGRLGHGRGYYDRFLAKAPQAFKLGLAFDFQIVGRLPVTMDDVPMDALITPDGIHRFHN